MLSHDITVNGGTPAARRRASASTTNPNTLTGTAPGCRSAASPGSEASSSPVTWLTWYPPSVIVSETIRVAGSTIRSSTAAGSSGANR